MGTFLLTLASQGAMADTFSKCPPKRGLASAENTHAPVVAHGTPMGEIAWSSVDHLPKHVLTTRSTLNVQLVPKRRQKSQSSKGDPCLFSPIPYSKLQVGVRARRRGQKKKWQYHLFDNLPVDCPSDVHRFTFKTKRQRPIPVVLEVMNVKWDWSCQSYANQGFPHVASVCPWDTVWPSSCYELELRFVTDNGIVQRTSP